MLILLGVLRLVSSQLDICMGLNSHPSLRPLPDSNVLQRDICHRVSTLLCCSIVPSMLGFNKLASITGLVPVKDTSILAYSSMEGQDHKSNRYSHRYWELSVGIPGIGPSQGQEAKLRRQAKKGIRAWRPMEKP